MLERLTNRIKPQDKKTRVESVLRNFTDDVKSEFLDREFGPRIASWRIMDKEATQEMWEFMPAGIKHIKILKGKELMLISREKYSDYDPQTSIDYIEIQRWLLIIEQLGNADLFPPTIKAFCNNGDR